MKKLQLIVTLGFILLLCQSVQAQWAGPDPVVVRKPDNSQKAVIGPADATLDASYHWEGPHIFSHNHNNPQIVINPQSDGEVYTVTRVTACGEEQDDVVVRMKEYPTLVSVIPKKTCYNRGDPIELSDFEIVTDPPGYGYMVSVSPNHAPTIGWELDHSEAVSLTFALSYESYCSSKTIVVDVYNDDVAVSADINASLSELPSDYKKLMNLLKELKDAFEDTKDLTQWFQKIGAFSPCLPQFDVGVGLPSSPVYRISCCNGEPILCFGLHGPAFHVEGGIDCEFPIPGLSIGKLAGLYVHLGVVMGLTVGPFDFLYKGDCSDVILPVFVYVEGTGGVTALLLSDNIFSFKGYISLKGQSGFNLKFAKGIKYERHPFDVDVSIKGKVTAASLISYSVNIPLGSWQVLK